MYQRALVLSTAVFLSICEVCVEDMLHFPASYWEPCDQTSSGALGFPPSSDALLSDRQHFSSLAGSLLSHVQNEISLERVSLANRDLLG